MVPNSRLYEFDWENMPSPGLAIVMPHIAKACYRAYYEHTRANLPIKDFKFSYYLTDEDLEGLREDLDRNYDAPI